jgi:hypothetical protein
MWLQLLDKVYPLASARVPSCDRGRVMEAQQGQTLPPNQTACPACERVATLVQVSSKLNASGYAWVVECGACRTHTWLDAKPNACGCTSPDFCPLCYRGAR